NVAHADCFQHRAHPTTRDNTCTRGGGFEQHLRAAPASDHRLRDSRASKGDLLHILAGAFRPLADTVGYTARLADADTHATFVITDDDHRAESEAATTLNYFCHTPNIDDALIKFFALLVTLAGFAASFSVRHNRSRSLLEFQTSF